MTYTEDHKQQLRDFVKEGLGRVVAYMQQTMGFPTELTMEELAKYETLGEQMSFLDAFYVRHPKVFKGMPHFKP